MSEILEMLKDGPVPTRCLRNRRAAFRSEHARLLREGKIVESGSGTKLDPKYVGLPGATFPGQQFTVRPADVCLLMLAGATEDEARAALKTAIATGGEAEVVRLSSIAEERILERGLNPVTELRNAMNRRAKGKAVVLRWG